MGVPFDQPATSRNVCEVTSQYSPGPGNMSACLGNVLHALSDVSDDESDLSHHDNDELDGQGKINDNNEGKDQLHDILEDIGGSFTSSTTAGPAIHDKLAQLANTGFRTFMSHEKTKELGIKYPSPSNCQSMTVPKTNPEIYTSLRTNGDVQGLDRSIQKSQEFLLYSATPLLQLMDTFMTHDASQPFPMHSAMRLAGDAFRLLTASLSSLTLRRRELIKPYLQGKFRKICNQTNPVSDFLFGSDLNQQVKEISDAGRIDLVRTQQNFNQKQHHYQRPHNYERSQHFRDRSAYQPNKHRRGNLPAKNKEGFFRGKAFSSCQEGRVAEKEVIPSHQ